MTTRLYHDDAYLRRFDATVTAVIPYEGKLAVVLDRTAFYPEAGGQLGDRGMLGGSPVRDTQELEDGAIAHVLDATLPAVGARPAGAQDPAPVQEQVVVRRSGHGLILASLQWRPPRCRGSPSASGVPSGSSDAPRTRRTAWPRRTASRPSTT